MFNSVTLEVVIGLVFIYLLYSLLATTINEMIASALGLRARMLAKAIKRMLDDGMTEKHFWSDLFSALISIMRFILKQINYVLPFFSKYLNTESKLSDKFFESPGIKYSAENKLYSRPSYISASDFSKSLVDLLKTNGSGINSMGQVGDSLQKNYLLIEKETHRFIFSLFNDSYNDLEKFKALLEEWFNKMMGRTSGWYKRQSQLIVLIIGFLLAVTFNVDTIKLVNTLSKDRSARTQMVSMANQFAKDQKTEKYISTAANDSLLADSLLYSTYKQLDSSANMANSVLGLGWNLDMLLKKENIDFSKNKAEKLFYEISKICSDTRWLNLDINNSAEKKIIENINDHFNRVFTKCKIKKTGNSILISGIRNFTAGEKIWYIIYKTTSSGSRFFGFLITALAISLGAPFWFDLLSKLVNLRGAGSKPSDNSSGKNESNAETKTSASSRVG